LSLSTAYDAIVSRIQTLFPNHKRLGDGIDIEQNPNKLLKQGWALHVAPGGSDAEAFVCNISSAQVNFILTFTRDAPARELDAAGKADTEKELLEDFQVLLNDIHSNNLNLDPEIVNGLTFDGIDKVRLDDGRVLQLACNFTVQNFTNL